MSCINPMAPLRETALGLKLDSTFTSARTRFGSTLWRAAALSMAASICIWVSALREEEAAASLDGLPRYSSHFRRGRLGCSHVGVRNRFPAAFGGAPENQMAGLRTGTGPRPKRLLGNCSHFVVGIDLVTGVVGARSNRGVRSRLHARRDGKEGRDSCGSRRQNCEFQASAHTGSVLSSSGRYTSAPTFPEPDGEFLPE